MEEMINIYNILVGKRKRKRPHLRPYSGWKDNIKKILKEIGYYGVSWNKLLQHKDQWQVF
jgi:hypothetical protein